MRRLLIFLVPVVGSVFTQGCCSSYSCHLKKSLREIFGQDLKGYTFRSTPVGNFGIGTIYNANIEKKEIPEDEWLLGSVDSWFQDTVSEEQKKASLAKIIEEGEFGIFQYGKKISNSLALNAVIPNIEHLVDVGAGGSWSRGVKVTLSATRATNRKLNWSNFMEVYKKGWLTDETMEYIARDDIAMGAADIVLEGYSADVTVDSKLNANLSASLNKLVGKVVGDDLGLGVSVQQGEKGTFQISSEKPVVAAVLYRKPLKGHAVRSRGGEVTLTKNIELWQPVSLPNKVLKPIEEDRARSQVGVK